MSIGLEQAIALAKTEAFQDGDSIVIDRRKQISRKRIREKEENEIKNLGDKNTNDAHFWKQKYMEVKKLRDEAEEDLENQIKLSNDREVVLEKYTKLLLQKIDDIQNNSENKNPKSNITNTSNLNDSENKYLIFFELMTSMSVKFDGNGVYICTLKNKVKKNATRFVIEDKKKDELEYIPKANVNLLPDYLQNEITFERNMAPIILADAIQALYDE